jgi:hypothetical protein
VLLASAGNADDTLFLCPQCSTSVTIDKFQSVWMLITHKILGGIMSESKPQPKPSLARAKAIIREQWPEVLQVLGNRSTHAISSKKSSIRPTFNESNPSS